MYDIDYTYTKTTDMTDTLSIYKPLDIVYVKSTRANESELDKLKDIAAPWDDIGIVVSTTILSTICNGKPDTLYLWGSLGEDVVPDVETGKCLPGVRIRELEAILNAYKDVPDMTIGRGKLISNPLDKKFGEWPSFYEERTQFIQSLVEKVYTYPYHTTSSWWNLLCCCCKRRRHLLGPELVLVIYQMLGIVGMDAKTVSGAVNT